MCGIIGYLSAETKSANDDAQEFVANQYEAQHHRGQKGFGLIEIDKKGRVTVKRATEPVKMMVDLRMSKAPNIILHHRAPTSTENSMDQTHPMVICNKELKFDWLITHNGVIRNSRDLKKIHEELGYEYLTFYKEAGANGAEKFNDTEAFAVELARFLENKAKEIATTGPAAFIAVKIDKDRHRVVSVISGTNGTNPMEVAELERGFLMASENEYESKALKADEAVTFKALYAKKTGDLIGFKMVEDLPELVFKKEYVAPAPVRAPYSSAYDDEDEYFGGSRFGNAYERPPAGFNRSEVEKQNEQKKAAHEAAYGGPHTVLRCAMPHYHFEEVREHFNKKGKDHLASSCQMPQYHGSGALHTPRNSAPIEDESKIIMINSPLEILKSLGDTKLGEVFKNKSFKDHEVVQQFDGEKFGKIFISEGMEAAEAYWKEFKDSLFEYVSMSDVLEETLEDHVDISGNDELDKIVSIAMKDSKDKMSILASNILPMYRLQAFVEAALTLGWRHELQQSGKVVKLPGSEVTVVGGDEEAKELPKVEASSTSDKKTTPSPEHGDIRTQRLKRGVFYSREESSEAIMRDLWKPEMGQAPLINKYAPKPEGWEEPGKRNARLAKGEFHSYAEYSEAVDRKIYSELPSKDAEHDIQWGGPHFLDLCKQKEFHSKEKDAKLSDEWANIRENATEESLEQLFQRCKNVDKMSIEKYPNNNWEYHTAIHFEAWPLGHDTEFCKREDFHSKEEPPRDKRYTRIAIRNHDEEFDKKVRGVHTDTDCKMSGYHTKFTNIEREEMYGHTQRTTFSINLLDSPKVAANPGADVSIAIDALADNTHGMVPEEIINEAESLIEQVETWRDEEVNHLEERHMYHQGLSHPLNAADYLKKAEAVKDEAQNKIDKLRSIIKAAEQSIEIDEVLIGLT